MIDSTETEVHRLTRVRRLPVIAGSVWLALTACLAPVAGPAPAPAQATAPSLTNAERDGLEAEIRAQMKRRAVPGLQVAIVRHGRIVFDRAYGIADLETGAPVTNATLFTLNSSTKAFTGVAIMQLVQTGKLSLDANVAPFIGDWPPQWGTVTVRQLLTHVSGLPDVLEQPKGQGTGNLIGNGDQASAWAAVKTRPVEAAPGARFRYNQTNYVLLGKIIERVSGMPFTRFIAMHEFAPLGATGFAYGETRTVMPGRTRIYRYAGGAVDGSARGAPLEHALDEFAPFMLTAGGLNGSATDVARWLIALQDGTLLDRASLATLWAPGRYADGRPTQWGMGWPLRPHPRHPVATGIGGRRSAFFVYPEDDLAVVVLANLAGANPEEFIGEIAGVLVPDLRLVNGGGLSEPANRLRLALASVRWKEPKAVYGRLRHRFPGFAVDEEELNGWGGRLLDAGRLSEAVAVLTLNTQLRPASSNTWDSLAEAYEAQGRSAAAVAAYRRALTLDAENGHARARLAAIRPTAPAVRP